MKLEGLGQLKKSNNFMGNQTRDLPACSTVPQPTTLPREQGAENTWTQKDQRKLLANYHQNNQIIEDEMGRECSMNGRADSFGGKVTRNQNEDLHVVGI
jgi:hypothetical protein